MHVTVPAERRIQPVRGVALHRSRRAAQAMHPTAMPPRTRVEDTILDLVDAARGLDEAVGWVTRGLGRRLTTPDRLRAALTMRSRIRWRAVLTELLSPDLAGVLSVLEHRYVRDVERPHNLPAGDRQAAFRQDGRSGCRDAPYRVYRLAVLAGLSGRAERDVGARRVGPQLRPARPAAAGIHRAAYPHSDPPPGPAAAGLNRAERQGGARGAKRAA